MELVRGPVEHLARGSVYEICIYRVAETGEYSTYVTKDGVQIGPVVPTASEAVITDAKVPPGVDMVQQIIDAVVDDIDRNEFGEY